MHAQRWLRRVFPAASGACALLGGCHSSNALSLGDWQLQDDEHVLIRAESRDWAYRGTLTRPMSVIDSHRDGRIGAFGGDVFLTRCEIPQ